MSGATNKPTIIKRKKVSAGDGHHGGAWKVAYADFVTAMMAFFMLMWLLNATTEQQRRGIADYFSPTIPLAKVSGGGDGAFGGDDVSEEDVLIKEHKGASPLESGEASGQNEFETSPVQSLEEIEETLMGKGGESLVADKAMRHIVTRVTDEGLVIELFDRPERQLFAPRTATPDPILRDIAAMLARVLTQVENPISISGYSRSWPIVVADDPSWDLTIERSQLMRDLLLEGGFDEARVFRLTGHADRSHQAPNPFAIRNNRIEVTVLRSD